MKGPDANLNLNWPTAMTVWLLVAGWAFGIAVAKGFWMTLLAVLLPPVAFILSAGWVANLFQ